MTMPTFCSCGLRPRPSSGVKAMRSNGFSANSMTLTKNATTACVTAATYGSSAACRREVSSCARAAKHASTTAQNSSEPFCPAQNAATVYGVGRLRDVYAQTYWMLKSWERRPFQSETDATASARKTPYTDRVTASSRSALPRQRPEKPTTAPQSASRKAVQSAKLPRNVMRQTLLGPLSAAASYRDPHLASTSVARKVPSRPSRPSTITSLLLAASEKVSGTRPPYDTGYSCRPAVMRKSICWVATSRRTDPGTTVAPPTLTPRSKSVESAEALAASSEGVK